MRSFFGLLNILSFCFGLLACEENQSHTDLTDLSLQSLDALVYPDQSLFDLDLLDQEQQLTQSQDQDVNQNQDRNFPLPPPHYPLFALPIFADDITLIDQRIIFGVDHDPSTGQRIRCEDYMGRIFPYCYDGHLGSDFILLGGFETMDQGSARVQSALAGVVIDIADGNYDRCHADITTADVNCDGYPMRANYVSIQHDNGWKTDYYHLKRGSVAVNVGERVNCGTLLGLIGSSGYSSAPHLHFEVSDPYGTIWDPFAGPSSQEFSLWNHQPSSGSSDSLPSTSCSSP